MGFVVAQERESRKEKEGGGFYAVRRQSACEIFAKENGILTERGESVNIAEGGPFFAAGITNLFPHGCEREGRRGSGF